MTEHPLKTQEDRYLKDRVNDQINWLNGKSSSNQQSYKLIRTTVIILSISIPFATGYVDEPPYATYVKFGIGLAGVLIAVLESILALQKYQENWVQYRTTSETPTQEKMMFTYRAGRYADTDTPFQDFVMEVESILGNENKTWGKYVIAQKDGKKGDQS